MIVSDEGGMDVQSAAIRPERSRLLAAVVGLLALTGLMVLFPRRLSAFGADDAAPGLPAGGVPPAMGRLAGCRGACRRVSALPF